jgi:hypothetical protein
LIRFLDFHKERVRRKELAAGTVKNYYRAVKLFCEMNDLSVNWKKISRGLPRVKKSSSDRAPTLEELRKMMEYPPPKMTVLVYDEYVDRVHIGETVHIHANVKVPLKSYDKPYSGKALGSNLSSVLYAQSITDERREQIKITDRDKRSDDL